jgi:hypothetical protein
MVLCTEDRLGRLAEALIIWRLSSGGGSIAKDRFFAGRNMPLEVTSGSSKGHPNSGKIDGYPPLIDYPVGRLRPFKDHRSDHGYPLLILSLSRIALLESPKIACRVHQAVGHILHQHYCLPPTDIRLRFCVRREYSSRQYRLSVQMPDM